MTLLQDHVQLVLRPTRLALLSYQHPDFVDTVLQANAAEEGSAATLYQLLGSESAATSISAISALLDEMEYAITNADPCPQVLGLDLKPSILRIVQTYLATAVGALITKYFLE